VGIVHEDDGVTLLAKFGGAIATAELLHSLIAAVGPLLPIARAAVCPKLVKADISRWHHLDRRMEPFVSRVAIDRAGASPHAAHHGSRAC
jgi:hypothetical protein